MFKPIKGYEGLYKVSDTGEILSIKRNNGYGSRNEDRVRKFCIKFGYATIVLSKDDKVKTYLVHRIVAEAFIPNPKKLPQINHRDGNKLNNRVSNLEWCDHSWNQTHARKLGIMGGERQKTAKLTERDVRAIRRIYPKLSKAELAKAFDIGPSTIDKIIKKEYWKYIDDPMRARNH